jgi:hypothetical protein
MASLLNDDDNDVKKALSLIESARLPHPSGPILSSFIIEALNPRSAAQYVLHTCRPDHNQRICLLQIVSDWTYLVESSMCPISTCRTPSRLQLLIDN